MVLLYEQDEDEVVPVNNVKAYGGVEVELHYFLTSAIDGCEKLPSLPDRSPPQNIDHRTH